MASKTYKTYIDCRILGEEIKFIFLISNVPGNTTSKSYNKKKCITITYNTNNLVEAICMYQGDNERLFLRFSSAHLKIENNLNLFGLRKTDLFLEVFKTNKGVHGFESVKGNGFGAFLSHPKYFSTKQIKNTTRGVGAMLPFEQIVMGKMHSLQMLLPGANITRNIAKSYSFDMDIHIQSEGQYTKSLGFKTYKEDITIVEGTETPITTPQQIINVTKDVKLPTTYIPLTSNDLASREIIFDYNKELVSQNVDAASLTLINSNVYTIANPKNLNTNLESVGLTKSNIIEIPYNISREVDYGKIKTTRKILKNGKEMYPLGWINELRDNEIVSRSNKCLSLSFNNREQLISFSEKLKQQQIGNVETYPVVNTQADSRDTIYLQKKTYTKISQWIERSMLDEYNDVKFTYDGDSYIKTILICPRKKTKINNNAGVSKEMYSDGTLLRQLNGEPYVGDYHYNPNLGPVTGKDNKSTNQQLLTELYCYAPISANSVTDFYLTTYGVKKIDIYSSFTSTTSSSYEPNYTYDLHISGDSFSAHTTSTGTTSIPISNMDREYVCPMINDVNKQYKPYSFSGVYSGNSGGSLALDENNPKHYMTYTVKSSGVYRFTYKAFLNVKYTDTKWCDYVSRICPSTVTATTGTFPQNDYQTKRLINTAIIQGGEDETRTILQDTGGKGHPGYRYKRPGDGWWDETPINSGIMKFNFTASLLKYPSGSTTTGVVTGGTSGTPSTIVSTTVKRANVDGSADNYLTLDVSENDKYSNTYNVCITTGASATTIFSKQIPVILDTGLISLAAGEIIELAYDLNWESISKGNYFGGGGTTNLDINLGHQLDNLGNKTASPWYRGVKLSTSILHKNLFFDSSRMSIPFTMKTDGMDRQVRLDGTLYISDRKCGNIKRPTITPQSFLNQTFLDSSAPNHKLVWDLNSQKPVNNWQNLLENNTIKDYQLTNTNNKLTGMKQEGIFCFYIPTYNSEYGVKCDFNFPQVTQSYVIVNKFKNFFGNDLTHYIVVTPTCTFYKPCSTTKLLSDYDILHKTRPDSWKIQKVDKKITIGGKEVTIVSDNSDANTKPKTLPNQTICKYFCDCGQDVAEHLEIDPIYGITDIFTDLNGKDCTDCVENSRKHCSQIHAKCKPVIIEDCSELKDYAQSTTETGIPIKLKGTLVVNTKTTTTGDPRGNGEGPGGSGDDVETDGPSGKPTDVVSESLYSCKDGVCFEDKEGIYTSLDECISRCKRETRGGGGPQPPKDPDNPIEDSANEAVIESKEVVEKGVTDKPTSKEEITKLRQKSIIEKEKSGICKTGYYWCEKRGCIPLKEEC